MAKLPYTNNPDKFDIRGWQSIPVQKAFAGGKYEELRRQLIKFFEWRGSFFPDELADETLNRVARKIDGGEEIEKNVIALALGIARFVFLETLKRPDNRRAEMEELTTVVFVRKGPQTASYQEWRRCIREHPGPQVRQRR